jgi:broad specificity phosphatase PhoE
LAEAWTHAPGYIGVSPFLRAQQTAQPTIQRFAGVPVATWPIYEFTFWDPAYWGAGEPRDQMDKVAKYWSRGDVNSRYGGGAESFSMLLERARATLGRLAALETEEPILLFTHGHFIQALRQTILYPGWSSQKKMQRFLEFDEQHKVRNAQSVRMNFDGLSWDIE